VPTALVDLSVLATDTRTRGIGRYVADLGLGLARVCQQTQDIHVLGIERLHWFGRADVTDDISGAVERLLRVGRKREPHPLWAYRVRVALSAATRVLHPDLLHCGHPNATPLGNPGCPRITTCHDLIPLRYPEHYLDWRDGFLAGRTWLDQRRYQSADHVIAVSETTANDLVTLLGVPADKITVVYNGVDLSRWSPEPGEGDAMTRKRHGLAERSFVLCVGAADWRKNHENMLAAVAIARQRSPDLDLALAWAARLDFSDQLTIRKRALEVGLLDALLLLGYVPDEELAALYRGAVAQLFVSRAEGFGYPVVEAMACGCPVVTSDRSSTAEIAADAALLVNPEDPEAIAEAILRLADSREERARLSARGAVRARGFSIERMAEGTVAVYRHVVAQSR
jgi:alpha-1,3-rhamnosyl/mannosyltransferase